jgi:hypothetical protein
MPQKPRFNQHLEAVLLFFGGIFLVTILGRAFYQAHLVAIHEAFRIARDWPFITIAVLCFWITLSEKNRSAQSSCAGIGIGALFAFAWVIAWAAKLFFNWP